MTVLERVRRTIADHGLARDETRVVAAVSGGSDSMALLHLLAALDAAGELRLAGVVHFNHQLRDSAEADERVVREASARLARECFAERGDVAARAAREHVSIEQAARAARYECFDRARAHFNADAIALGHTKDDQAETFLLRLVRGAGPRGLAGMYPRNGVVVRPLLGCRRHELREWLAERQVAFVDDETNTDVSIPRNRVRAELMPLLAERFNPAIVDVLAGEADLAREAWHILETSANEIETSIVKPTTNGYVMDIASLSNLSPALRRVVVWRAMQTAAGAHPVSLDHVDAALRMLRPDGPPRMHAPAQMLERIAGSLVLTGRPPGVRGRVNTAEPSSPLNLASSANLFWYRLSIPGEVQLVEAGCFVSVESVQPDGSNVAAFSGRGETAFVRRDLCRESLAVRNRRPGDRFHPPGLAGRKTLQDYFVDRKVRRGDRDRIPLVVDETDRIVWVAGYGIDEAFRVTDAGQAVLTLKVSPLDR